MITKLADLELDGGGGAVRAMMDCMVVMSRHGKSVSLFI
jgi:hypothetical protein